MRTVNWSHLHIAFGAKVSSYAAHCTAVLYCTDILQLQHPGTYAKPHPDIAELERPAADPARSEMAAHHTHTYTHFPGSAGPSNYHGPGQLPPLSSFVGTVDEKIQQAKEWKREQLKRQERQHGAARPQQPRLPQPSAQPQPQYQPQLQYRHQHPPQSQPQPQAQHQPHLHLSLDPHESLRGSSPSVSISQPSRGYGTQYAHDHNEQQQDHHHQSSYPYPHPYPHSCFSAGSAFSHAAAHHQLPSDQIPSTISRPYAYQDTSASSAYDAFNAAQQHYHHHFSSPAPFPAPRSVTHDHSLHPYLAPTVIAPSSYGYGSITGAHQPPPPPPPSFPGPAYGSLPGNAPDAHFHHIFGAPQPSGGASVPSHPPQVPLLSVRSASHSHRAASASGQPSAPASNKSRNKFRRRQAYSRQTDLGHESLRSFHGLTGSKLPATWSGSLSAATASSEPHVCSDDDDHDDWRAFEAGVVQRPPAPAAFEGSKSTAPK